MKTSIVCLLLLVCSRTATAQAHPDLSGRWILENAGAVPPDAALQLTVQQIERTTSVFGVPLKEPVTFLIVDRSFATGSRTDRYEPVGVVGGTVEGFSGQPGELRARYSTKWEGRVLVITNIDLTTKTEREERWSLEESALVLTVTTRANGSESTTRLVYGRQ